MGTQVAGAQNKFWLIEEEEEEIVFDVQSVVERRKKRIGKGCCL